MKTELEPGTEVDPPQSPTDIFPWSEMGGIRCSLSICLPIANFTVNDLLLLAPGVVLASPVKEGKPVQLMVNGIQIAWSKFELKGYSLAARITELMA